jgi:hypothetical protein
MAYNHQLGTEGVRCLWNAHHLNDQATETVTDQDHGAVKHEQQDKRLVVGSNLPLVTLFHR